MKAKIGLSDAQSRGLAGILKTILADEYVLSTKTRNYHWNVTGPHFNDLHKVFEAQYGMIDGQIDEIAENIRYLGEKAPATLTEFLALARLKEAPAESPDAQTMLANLLADHEALIRSLRSDIDDAQAKFGSAEVADFLTGLLEEHSKLAWMLRATLG